MLTQYSVCARLWAHCCQCYFIKHSHQLLKGDAGVSSVLMVQKLRCGALRNGKIISIFMTEILTADCSYPPSLNACEKDCSKVV